MSLLYAFEMSWIRWYLLTGETSCIAKGLSLAQSVCHLNSKQYDARPTFEVIVHHKWRNNNTWVKYTSRSTYWLFLWLRSDNWRLIGSLVERKALLHWTKLQLQYIQHSPRSLGIIIGFNRKKRSCIMVTSYQWKAQNPVASFSARRNRELDFAASDR